MNQKRNIPFELSDEEKILYTYSQSVTLKLLEAMQEKYNQNSNTIPIDSPASGPAPEGHVDLDDLPLLMKT